MAEIITLDNFPFKLPPFGHQFETLDRSKEMSAYAIWWEQGTGKSKYIIDLASWLFLNDKIDCVILVSPNGVHQNWVDDEIPIHIPDVVREQSSIFMYDSSKHETLYHEQKARRMIHAPGLVWLSISYDAFMTRPVKTSRKGGHHKWMGGKKYMWEMLRRRRCLYVLDESIEIKAPKAARTKSVVASGVYGAYNRILNGTPIATGPFDVYKQMQFLDPGFWKKRGFGTLTEFKAHFGVWRVGKRGGGRTSENTPAWDLGDLVGFRRLPELRQILEPYRSRVLKKDVLDLPPKLYSKRYFEMNPEQKRVYEAIEQDCLAFLDDGGLVTAQLPIVQLLRCRQILSGYVPTDDPDDEPIKMLGKKNPRLELMVEEADRIGHKAIIWCNFIMDVDLLCQRLGKRAVRYDGTIGSDEKAANKRAFKTSDGVQFIVANEAAMCKGHTYTEAHSSYYYNNSFNFVHRVQSEDRVHRAGLLHPALYVDLIGGRVDKSIVRNLIKKMMIADEITGDQSKEWI